MFFLRSPVVKSHTFTMPSAPAVASVRPSALQLTPSTWCVWPSKLRTILPVPTSVTRAIRSAAPGKLEAQNSIGMRFRKVADELSGDRVPELDLAAARGLAAAGGELFSIA